MKFSESWLREWVNPTLNTEELVAQLTMAGLEVDGVEPVVSAPVSGVVVGEIIEVAPHPNADRLRVCQVAGHPDGIQQVVCGAPNARPGIKIPFATAGAVLPSDLKIKKAKLRDVESFGMLCSQVELKLGENDDGLWELPADAPVGEDLAVYLRLADHCIEVDLTPNRSDCLSVRGLAREVGVLNRLEVQTPSIKAVPPSIDDRMTVVLEAPEACPVYAGRVIRNIDQSRPSPLWLVERLRRSGLRSIDPVVDVTNYVLLELGQPMHAFDLDKLQGPVRARWAKEGESVELLDGQRINLNSDTLVIADAVGPQAMAGIMGGAATAVSDSTRNIFLESAFFAPTALAGRARSYGLHTDSSHRFERGVDYRLQVQAIERATALLLEITGGDAGPLTVQEADAQRPQPATVRLSRLRLERMLGLALEDHVVLDILRRLGLELLHQDEQGWQFQVPSYRFDIAIEVDLIEEIARVYGYGKLPVTTKAFNPALERHSETRTPLEHIRDHLISRGYQEAITYSFVDPALQRSIFPGQPAIELRNPISADMAVMRVSLLPGLLSALRSNINRQQSRAKLFESGLCFVSQSGATTDLRQEKGLAGVFYGTAFESGWATGARAADFYDLKGDVESLLGLTRDAADFRFEATATCNWLHPGQAAAVYRADRLVGHLGALHPNLSKELGFSQPVFVFEFSLAPLVDAKLPAFTAISRFPSVRRDLAIVVEEGVHFEPIYAAIRAAAGSQLKQLELFDVYRGPGIDPTQKSMAFNLVFQDAARTLREEEINASLAQVVARLEQEFNAKLR